MIHTCICDALAIRHPIVLGGMGSAASPPLVAAVSKAGGLGTLGTSGADGAKITAAAKAIRNETDEPFAINHLLFRMDEESYAATLAARPAVVAFAWASKDQDLRGYFKRAHDVATAILCVLDDLGYLGAALTAEPFRGHGAQQALIARRIETAASLGCRILVSETLSFLKVSLGNLQKAGFKAIFEKEVYEANLQTG